MRRQLELEAITKELFMDAKIELNSCYPTYIPSYIIFYDKNLSSTVTEDARQYHEELTNVINGL